MDSLEAINWLNSVAKHFEGKSEKNAINARKIADLILRLEGKSKQSTKSRVDEKLYEFLEAIKPPTHQ